MTRQLLICLLALAGCRPGSVELIRQGCEGTLSGTQCDGASCRVPEGTVVEAQDDAYCRFVGWQGACGNRRTCTPSGGAAPTVAIFERIAWPLDLTFQAPFVEVVVRPANTRLTETTRLVVPVGAVFRLEAVGPVGRRGVLTGDCRPEASACVVEGDRARSVAVHDEADVISLALEVQGQGVVRVGAATCGPATSCSIAAVRGQTLPLEAEAMTGHVFATWSRIECGTSTQCSVRLDAPGALQARFLPLRTLDLDSDGRSGSVEVNGVLFTLPTSLQLPEGTPVHVRARPAPDDTLESITGLPCTSPRTVDECRFSLAADLAGRLRFHRLFQWAQGGHAGLRHLVMTPSDGGVVVALAYDGLRDPLGLRDGGPSLNAAAMEFWPDAGSRVAPLGELPRRSQDFFLMQDGQANWWAMIGVAEDARFAWAGVDAGLEYPRPRGLVAGRLGGDLRPLPVVRALDVVPSGHSLTVAPPRFGAGVMAAYLTPPAIDGGVPTVGFVLTSPDLSSASWVPLGVGSWAPFVAVTSDGERHWTLSSLWNLGTLPAPCGRPVGAGDGLAISQFSGLTCMASSLASTRQADEWPDAMWLVRVDAGLLAFSAMRNSYAVRTHELAEFDDTLAPRWRTSIRPSRLYTHAGGFLASPVVKNEHEFWLVSQWRTTVGGLDFDAAGLPVHCEGDETTAILLTRHDRRLGGRATWATCLTDPTTNSRYQTLVAGVSPLGPGLTFALRPAVGLAPTREFTWGSQRVSVASGGEVRLFLTPP